MSAEKININNKIDKNNFKLGYMHFCGIGGIGMSAIAQVMHQNGFKVQGSDKSESFIVQSMLNMGIKIFPLQKESNLHGVSCLVYSSAINLETNEEILAAKKLNIPIIHRSVALGFIMEDYISIAISGSHGKTTTTSLLGFILDKCGFNPIIISGGIMNEYNSNYKIGNGKYIVVEADESDGSFVNFSSNYSLITNIDREHIDYYKSIEEIENIFQVLADKSDTCAVCYDDERLQKISSKTESAILKYGINDCVDYRIDLNTIKYQGGYSYFNVITKEKTYNIKAKLFGIHNIKNITGAFMLAKKLGCEDVILLDAISKFTGVKRRFTHVGTFNDALIIDDYAHHPTEIKAVISAALDIKSNTNMQNGRIIVVFQPHRYSRVYDLMEEFTKCFYGIDNLIINPIYAAGEENIHNIKLEDLSILVQKNILTIDIRIANLEHVRCNLAVMNLCKDDIVIFMGAGDITKFAYSTCDVLL